MREGIDGQDPNAQFLAPLHHLFQLAPPAQMTLERREAKLLGEAAVTIHNDRQMVRQRPLPQLAH